MLETFAGVEQRGEDVESRVNRCRTVALSCVLDFVLGYWGDDLPQDVGLLVVGEVSGVVLWLQAVLVGLGPYLQEVDFLALVVIVLGMRDPSASRCHLHISPLHDLDIAHVVLVGQLARDDVREDFEFSVGMGRKPCTRGYSVLIDDSQRSKAGKGWIVVIGERERMEGLQPTMICPTSSLRGSVLELQLASGHCTVRSGDYGLGLVEVLSEKGTAGTELS